MDRTQLLDRFRGGFADVQAAVAGITDAELDQAAPDGGWTPRQVLHHLADSETIAYVRLRRLIAEDEPTIVGYDEPEYARRLHYERPVDASLAVLAAVRAASLGLLEALSPAEWERRGTHTESGPYSVDDWLGIYAEHPYDHANQIGVARGGGRVPSRASAR
ncbi:MAG: DinB family protein [Chloroflexi bacterium]|nr:DinB family protein [Chloroflexota bacterium]MBA3740231.1 DinB family protein [Chloroflexota bacterium]